MNIFIRELKAYKWGLFFWSFGMFALIASGMAKFSAYSASGQSANDIFGMFPRSVQVIFGISGFDLSKVSGFFGILFLYIALMGTIHAVLLGSDIISKEERDRTSEFLYVKPIDRARVLTFKMLAGLFDIVVLNLVTLFSSIYFVKQFSGGQSVNKDIEILTVALLFLQLIFFFVGFAVSAGSRKPKAAASTATTVLMLTFIISFVVELNDKLNFLKYLTPFEYFNARNILADGHLSPLYVSISIIIIAILIFVTYPTYRNRDLNI
jgi:ABC-2 type transport system permease protein